MSEMINRPETIEQPRRLPTWVVIIAFVVMLMFLALIGWGLSRASQGAIAIGDPVPQFGFTTFDGQAISSTDFTGKVLVVNFWASWCKPCEQEAADLEAAWKLYAGRDDVIFLGVAWTDTDKKSLEYMSRFGITYPNGPDLGTRMAQAFRITGVPETYIIGKDGKLANFKFSPFLSVAEIQAMIDPLLED